MGVRREAARRRQQIEAAHKTGLAKGEVGIRDRKPVPTLTEFRQTGLPAFCRVHLQSQGEDAQVLTNGVDRLLDYDALAGEKLDSINSDKISGYVAKRQLRGLQTSSINRELQVLELSNTR